ncbi:hypothetical protein NC653_004478 [Populus alba x Populus x berolinensis]|uniref:Large ribosomal subunit protein uL6 alpha-beta domain-containing protein n=1 Tax=Populus alba x Populus x berolinensis TaxID=444605 RepID=A0AAD6RU97_9ROSI|nr:hypothetical protein NC653_004478 [Populus alba x Populus x berolinensis]
MKTILSSETMDIPDGVKIKISARIIEVEGPRGKLSRNFKHLNLDFQLIKDEEGKRKLKIDAWFATRKTSAAIRTALSHVENLITGVTKGYRYKMRFVYAHFPINASITNSNTAIEIRNFLGEKKVRKVDMLEGVSILRSEKVKDELVLDGNDIELVSRSAALINQKCHVKNKDIRKFLDGIYTILSSETMDIPDGVKIKISARIIEVEGPRGKLSRNFKHLNLDFQLIKDEEGKRKLKIDAWFATRKTSAAIRTALSHVENLITGVTKGYRYKMRFVYAHFPINASITNSNTAIEIRNFLGEKKVRKVDMLEGVSILRSEKVKDELVLDGNDIELVSRSAALINQKCHVKNKDIRKFLDGIYTILSSETMDIPDGVKIKISARIIEVEGPRGKLSRNFKHLNLDFQLIKDEEGKRKLKIDAWFATRKTSAAIRTALSHVENLITGVTKGYRYKMRFVYAHFPINASITNSNTAIEIRNFLGEKKVRKVDMLEGVSILRSEKVKDELVLDGNDIELVSRSAALINQKCHVKNKDIRKFLDGIYVSEKGTVVEEE